MANLVRKNDLAGIFWRALKTARSSDGTRLLSLKCICYNRLGVSVSSLALQFRLHSIRFTRHSVGMWRWRLRYPEILRLSRRGLDGCLLELSCGGSLLGLRVGAVLFGWLLVENMKEVVVHGVRWNEGELKVGGLEWILRARDDSYCIGFTYLDQQGQLWLCAVVEVDAAHIQLGQ